MLEIGFDWSVVIMFLLSAYLGWNIGANDAANCIGPIVGAGIISLRKGLLLVSLFVFLGALLQGSKTIHTMGNLSSIKEIDVAIFAVLLGASLVLTVLTIKGIPVSTTFAVIGATIGVSLLLKAQVMWFSALAVIICGLITPLASFSLGYFVYWIFLKFVKRYNFITFHDKLKWLIIGGGLFMSYSLGANNIGNSMGLLVQRGYIVPASAGLFGGLALSIGALTMGKRVVLTVGKQISVLDAQSAFAASVGAGICLYVLAYFGIPTSSSFAIVGSVAGVGFAHSTRIINVNLIKKIFREWIFCPFFSAFVAVIVYFVLNSLI